MKREEGRREDGGREERKEVEKVEGGKREEGRRPREGRGKLCWFTMAARQNGLTKINVSLDMFGACQFKILGSTELVPSEAWGGLSLAPVPCLSGVVV